MKKNLLQIKRNGNKLTKKVINMILEYGTAEDMLSFIHDVQQYGCQAGMVHGLIYYNDTIKFYKKYRKEINLLLTEIGEPVETLFGNNWDEDDPLALEDGNQNLLTWFGFEETVNRISESLEL